MLHEKLLLVEKKIFLAVILINAEHFVQYLQFGISKHGENRTIARFRSQVGNHTGTEQAPRAHLVHPTPMSFLAPIYLKCSKKSLMTKLYDNFPRPSLPACNHPYG